MSWFDTGVNLLDPRFDIAQELDACCQACVTHLLVISSDIAESEKALSLVKTHSHSSICLYATAGIHPHYADHANEKSWTQLQALLADKDISAIGECGLDFNRNFSSKENQVAAFDKQLALAQEHGVGVYLHERDAFEQQISMLKPALSNIPFAIAHCFTGTVAQMWEYVHLGCMIGITAWVCDDKRGQDLQAAVKDLPLERLLLETDAPYLFPKTLKPRAKQNSSRYIKAIAEKVAELKNIPLEQVRQASFENALKVLS